MLRVVLLLLVAIVASVSATCIGAGFAAAYQAGTGINPVPVGVSTDPVSVSKLPICGGTDAFPKQADGTYLTCCSLDAFNQIRAFGEEYTTAIEAVTASTVAFNNAKDQLDKAKKQICAQVPTACDQFSQVIDILKTFLDGFSKHYPQCSAAYRDYLEGAFCAVCRPDFFPAIASQSGSTITFYWAPETCTDIASACAPVVNDIYNLIVQFSTAFGSLNLATGTSAPSFGDFLADVPGATNAEKISYWLCNAQLRGVYTVDFVGVQTIASSLGYALAGSGLKRDQLENVLSEHANRLRDASRTLSLRQSSNAANSYNGTYNPVAVGAKSNFIGSAATVTISFAAFVFAMIAVFLF